MLTLMLINRQSGVVSSLPMRNSGRSLKRTPSAKCFKFLPALVVLFPNLIIAGKNNSDDKIQLRVL